MGAGLDAEFARTEVLPCIFEWSQGTRGIDAWFDSRRDLVFLFCVIWYLATPWRPPGDRYRSCDRQRSCDWYRSPRPPGDRFRHRTVSARTTPDDPRPLRAAATLPSRMCHVLGSVTFV